MKTIKWLLFVGIIVSLTACSLFSPSESYEVKKYRLTAINQQRITHKRLHKTLLVSQPTAAAGYQTASMQYILKPLELSSFVKNAWVAPPAEMLMPLIVQSLRNSGRFQAVVSAPFIGNTDYRLDTKIEQIDQNFLVKPSVVTLVLQADLVNNGTSDVIASRRFKAMVPASHDAPYGGVQAANSAVAKVMRELSQFLSRA